MEWFCTMLWSGILLSFGWNIGELIFEWIKEFICEAPDGIGQIRSYRNKQKRRKCHSTVKRERS